MTINEHTSTTATANTATTTTTTNNNNNDNNTTGLFHLTYQMFFLSLQVSSFLVYCKLFFSNTLFHLIIEEGHIAFFKHFHPHQDLIMTSPHCENLLNFFHPSHFISAHFYPILLA